MLCVFRPIRWYITSKVDTCVPRCVPLLQKLVHTFTAAGRSLWIAFTCNDRFKLKSREDETCLAGGVNELARPKQGVATV
jgi:hypothetical protein